MFSIIVFFTLSENKLNTYSKRVEVFDCPVVDGKAVDNDAINYFHIPILSNGKKINHAFERFLFSLFGFKNQS